MVYSIECAIADGPAGALQPHLFLFSIGNSAAPPVTLASSRHRRSLLSVTNTSGAPTPWEGREGSNRRGLQNRARRAGGGEASGNGAFDEFASGWSREVFEVTGEIGG